MMMTVAIKGRLKNMQLYRKSMVIFELNKKTSKPRSCMAYWSDRFQVVRLHFPEFHLTVTHP